MLRGFCFLCVVDRVGDLVGRCLTDCELRFEELAHADDQTDLEAFKRDVCRVIPGLLPDWVGRDPRRY